MKPVDIGSFLTLHYRLAGPDGTDVINTFGARPATLSLGVGQLAPAMESLLVGLTAGRRETFDLAPGTAFGERKPELVQRVARSLLEQLGEVCFLEKLKRVLLCRCEKLGGRLHDVLLMVSDHLRPFSQRAK